MALGSTHVYVSYRGIEYVFPKESKYFHDKYYKKSVLRFSSESVTDKQAGIATMTEMLVFCDHVMLCRVRLRLEKYYL